jgi:zinc protease
MSSNRRPAAHIGGFIPAALLILGTPALGVAAPVATRTVLANGLTVLVAERPGLPVVTLHLLVDAGSLLDPPERAGLAHLTADLLTHGTPSRSAIEVSEAIEFVGGSLAGTASTDYATLTLSVLTKDLDLGLDLFADVLVRPNFPEAEFRRRVAEVEGAIRKKEDDPFQVAHEAFNALLFGAHPYGRPEEGTPETIRRITRADVVAFHAAYYRPHRAILAVAGDVTASGILPKVERALAEWRTGPHWPPPLEPARPLTGRAVRRIDRDVAQATIVWGHGGVSRDNPDYYALAVMNQILGAGGSSSRLYANIREERGWAYDVHSELLAQRHPGSFLVSLQTRPETAAPAIREIEREIRRMRDELVPETELADAKTHLTGSFPMRLETTGQLAHLLTAVEFFGLGLDYPERYPRLIGAVTREEVQRVARQYLDPDRYVLVVLAKPGQAKIPE